MSHLYILSVNYWIKVGGGIRGKEKEEMNRSEYQVQQIKSNISSKSLFISSNTISMRIPIKIASEINDCLTSVIDGFVDFGGLSI